MQISVQESDFDVSRVLAELRGRCAHVGAVACFLGTVRDMNESRDVAVLTLEHYPGMTERALERVAEEAQARFPVADMTVIHRVGTLYPSDQIVLVAVASAHRHDALHACTFVMDYLKTHAPFWKKETDLNGATCWVDARESDAAARARWFADFDAPDAVSGDVV